MSLAGTDNGTEPVADNCHLGYPDHRSNWSIVDSANVLVTAET